MLGLDLERTGQLDQYSLLASQSFFQINICKFRVYRNIFSQTLEEKLSVRDTFLNSQFQLLHFKCFDLLIQNWLSLFDQATCVTKLIVFFFSFCSFFFRFSSSLCVKQRVTKSPNPLFCNIFASLLYRLHMFFQVSIKDRVFISLFYQSQLLFSKDSISIVAHLYIIAVNEVLICP